MKSSSVASSSSDQTLIKKQLHAPDMVIHVSFPSQAVALNACLTFPISINNVFYS